MKRKAKTRYTRNHSSLRVFLVVLSATAVFVLGYFGLLPSIYHSEDPCANSLSCAKDLTGKFEANNPVGEYMGNTIPLPTYLTKEDLSIRPVLGDTTAKKTIHVDLTTQHLYAYEDDRIVYDFPVSTGKWYPTPTGTFHIWSKLRYTRMSGGDPASGTYYNLPNVPYVMFYYNDEISKYRGFSIHGTYWHENFGHPMSHGCVNMKTEDVATLFYWANPPQQGNITYATAESPGTEVTISGVTPNE